MAYVVMNAAGHRIDHGPLRIGSGIIIGTGYGWYTTCGGGAGAYNGRGGYGCGIG
jgi:hypothetical protein